MIFRYRRALRHQRLEFADQTLKIRCLRTARSHTDLLAAHFVEKRLQRLLAKPLLLLLRYLDGSQLLLLSFRFFAKELFEKLFRIKLSRSPHLPSAGQLTLWGSQTTIGPCQLGIGQNKRQPCDENNTDNRHKSLEDIDA